MSELIRGAAFDSSNIHTTAGQWNNIAKSRHDINLEEDYKLLRGAGFTFFRESAWIEKTLSKKEIDWSWLDRIAAVSNGETQLAISHYDWIEDMDPVYELIQGIVQRYRGCFHSFIPFVESGTYCHMLTEYLLPKFNHWWDAWQIIREKQVCIALALKMADPSCKVALAEPYNAFCSYEDQARPFNTLLGKFDREAQVRGLGPAGDKDLLDMIGLNLLHYDGKHPFHESIIDAGNRFPGKEIFISETTNVWFGGISTPQQWINHMVSEIEIARNEGGVSVERVMWCPALQMFSHDEQKPIGGYLFDLNRKRA